MKEVFGMGWKHTSGWRKAGQEESVVQLPAGQHLFLVYAKHYQKMYININRMYITFVIGLYAIFRYALDTVSASRIHYEVPERLKVIT